MAEIFNGRKEIKYAYGCFGTAAQVGRRSNHFAYDLTCPDQPDTSTEVFAVEGGTVVQSRIVNNGVGSGTAEWGNYITIQTASGYFDTYAHLASRAVAQGQKIAAGAKLGVMGNTGNAAYAANPYRHVHFERRRTATGTGVDATAVLGIKNAVGVYGNAASTTNTNKGNDAMKLKVCAAVDTTPRSELLAKGWVLMKGADGTLRMYDPNGARIARDVASDMSDLSPIYEWCVAEMQENEILLAVE